MKSSGTIKRPILVTGSHRSGTTWVGNMLALAPRTAYVHEPFNLSRELPGVANPFRHWFEYIGPEASNAEYEYFLSFVMDNYRYPMSLKGFIDKPANVLTAAFSAAQSSTKRLIGYRPIIKDPIAFFSAEWLAQRFNMDVVVMIRNPLAFCSSLKVMDWTMDFNNFLEQPALMRAYLQPYDAQIRDFAQNSKPVVEQATLLWNCIHHTIGIYRQKHPDWLFVKHEDISKNPVGGFAEIYRTFRLEFTEKAKQSILHSSGEHNPAQPNGALDFRRNSIENLHNWKKRLTPEETELIERETAEIAESLYPKDGAKTVAT